MRRRYDLWYRLALKLGRFVRGQPAGRAAERPAVRRHGDPHRMIVFRCTQRLAKRFHLGLTDGVPHSTGLLGDWYANLLNVGHSRLVLCLSERTLLPVLLPARQREFPSRFPIYLAPVLEHLGIPPGLIETEADAASEVALLRTRSRQVLGALNDFAFNAGVHLAHGESALQVSLRLTEMPSKPIHYDSPGRVTQSLFAAQGRG